jgi:hypothetical protein
MLGGRFNPKRRLCFPGLTGSPAWFVFKIAPEGRTMAGLGPQSFYVDRKDNVMRNNHRKRSWDCFATDTVIFALMTAIGSVVSPVIAAATV